MQLTSSHNPLLRKIRQAVASGRPTAEGEIAAEGPHLAEELLRSSWRVSMILLTGSARAKHDSLVARFHAPAIDVSESAFRSISDTETSQGVLTLAIPPAWSWNDVLRRKRQIVVLDGIQNPGNAGTILRSAEAFGMTGVVFAGECVRIANSKLLRASAGSAFRVPFLQIASRAAVIEKLGAENLTIYALEKEGGTSIADAGMSGPLAIIVGGEGAGVSPEFGSRSAALTIPTIGVESLNAAVACAIVLYEVARQSK